jgi:hypothetical protein
VKTALALMDGARKYGPYNWRDEGVSASTYISAAERHIRAWLDGETDAADSKVHHLGHAIACLAIILDAETIGNLVDDRPRAAPTAALLEAEKHKAATNPDRSPSLSMPEAAEMLMAGETVGVLGLLEGEELTEYLKETYPDETFDWRQDSPACWTVSLLTDTGEAGPPVDHLPEELPDVPRTFNGGWSIGR